MRQLTGQSLFVSTSIDHWLMNFIHDRENRNLFAMAQDFCGVYYLIKTVQILIFARTLNCNTLQMCHGKLSYKFTESFLWNKMNKFFRPRTSKLVNKPIQNSLSTNVAQIEFIWFCPSLLYQGDHDLQDMYKGIHCEFCSKLKDYFESWRLQYSKEYLHHSAYQFQCKTRPQNNLWVKPDWIQWGFKTGDIHGLKSFKSSWNRLNSQYLLILICNQIQSFSVWSGKLFCEMMFCKRREASSTDSESIKFAWSPMANPPSFSKAWKKKLLNISRCFSKTTVLPLQKS